MTTQKDMLDNIQKPEYEFLQTNPHLGSNIVLLGLGGSRAYGTNVEGSDWDWRGIATRSPRDILTGRDFEQVTNSVTDTTIYSFEKIIKLLSSCIPNTIELLGLNPEHYLIVCPAGELLLKNKDIFLSKRAIGSCGGYAKAQLNRLINKSGRAIEEVIQNETRSIGKALDALRRGNIAAGIQVYEVDNETKLSIHDELPLETFIKISQVINNVHDDYKRSQRNDHAVEHGKLGKHMMHLCRLYFMALDILVDGKIVTYREKEHDFLMDVRNGKYLIDDKTPTKEFMDIVRDFEEQLDKAGQTSYLPDKPDEEAIQEIVAQVNESVVLGPKEHRDFAL